MEQLKEQVKQKYKKYRSLRLFLDRQEWPLLWSCLSQKQKEEIRELVRLTNLDGLKLRFESLSSEYRLLDRIKVEELRKIAGRLGISDNKCMPKSILLGHINGRIKDEKIDR